MERCTLRFDQMFSCTVVLRGLIAVNQDRLFHLSRRKRVSQPGGFLTFLHILLTLQIATRRLSGCQDWSEDLYLPPLEPSRNSPSKDTCGPRNAPNFRSCRPIVSSSGVSDGHVRHKRLVYASGSTRSTSFLFSRGYGYHGAVCLRRPRTGQSSS